MTEYKNLSKVNLNNFNNSLGELATFHEKFWIERLASLQPITIPYAKRTTLLLSKQQFASTRMTIPDQVAFCLKKQNPDCNLGDLITTAFVGYLARLSETNSFDLGFRDFKLFQELRNITGLASYVPCRFTINLEQGFPEFLSTVQEQMTMTRKRQTYARDLVISNPDLEKIFAHNPPDVFPVAIERVNEIAEAQSPPVNELTLSIGDHDSECVWFYNTAAFDQESITRISDQFTIFLQGIAEDSTQPLAYVPLLSEAEKHKILVEWNNTAVDYPLEKCIHQLFEAQVENTPDALAVVCEGQQLTYRELNERANQLAAYLQELGVKPETLVGICVERSLEMMVGLLGIIKAGGAYVPLDPNYPQERLQYMLQDSAASLLLTQQKLLPNLPDQSTQVICLDTEWDKIAEYSTATIERGVQPDNLVYIIYTSGSTGKPKGVEILHQGLSNYLHWCIQTYFLPGGVGSLVHSSIGFDATITALFAPLLVGQRVTLVSGEQEVEALATALLKKDTYSLVKLTPAHLKILDSLLSIEQLADQSQVFVIGGEALMMDVVAPWLTYAPNTRLINEYGPTETVVGCCIYEVKSDEQFADSIPIGHPIANTQLYILDSRLQPVPIGVPGELYIGGAGLARGYLNRPELTQEKFVTNPLNQNDLVKGQSKLYKTGDLARYLADGKIEYLGRIDAQVKIRGFRIELGEIEAEIALHPKVKQTVVMAREDRPGNKRLVAYIVPHQLQKITEEEIRQFIRQKLPDYMMPTAFVFLETFSLTPNGKIDLRVLPAPELTRDLSSKTFVPPRNQVERQLTKIWENVLGIKGIRITDNFFELGGESLLAVRLFTEIDQQFQQKLSLSTIFQAPTIEQLAKVLDEKEYLPNSSYLVPIQPSGNRIPFFCIHGAQGEVLFLRSLTNHLDPDQPFYAIRSPGQNGEMAPLTSVEAMAQLYVEEIRSIQPQGPYLIGGYSFGGLVAFEMAQQLREQGQEVALLALFDCYAPGSLKPLSSPQKLLKHLGNLTSIGPDYAFKKLKTFKARSLYRLFSGESSKNNYFQYLTSTQYFYNLINEFPNYTMKNLELWENLYQANLKARMNYQPKVYEGKVTVFRVKIDSTTFFYQPVDNCGWSELSEQEIKVYDCDGDHYTFMEEPYIRDLAKQLQASIISATKKLKSLESAVN